MCLRFLRNFRRGKRMPQWRKQLLDIHRRTYNRNRKLVRNSLGEESRELRAYARGYRNYLKQFHAISSFAELIKRVLSSDVVYHGDFHTLRESQRGIYQVIRRASESREIILCLEMFRLQDQEHVDAFLAGKIGQKAFLRRIDYDTTWGFDWEAWYPIIDFCRIKHIPILGINSDVNSAGSLKKRDEEAAKAVGRELVRNPHALVYVVDGDHHVSPNHLPREVESRLKVFDIVPERTIIYQNAENLYWMLAESGNEEAEVLRISKDSFCLMNTTPPNKLQSYISWLEYGDEQHYPGGEQWVQFMETTQSELVPKMVETICNALEIEYPTDDIERLSVYHARNLNVLRAIMTGDAKAVDCCLVRRKISDGEAFLLEYNSENDKSFLMYLPSSSLTMAAEESAHFVNASCRGETPVNTGVFDCFYRHVMNECLGFFGSKIVNQRRTAETTSAIRSFLGQHKSSPPTDSAGRMRMEVGRAILRHHYLEKKRANREEFHEKFGSVYSRKSAMPALLATQLGYILGYRLFDAVRKGKVPMKVVRDLYHRSFPGSAEAFQAYRDLANVVRQRSTRRRETANSHSG